MDDALEIMSRAIYEHEHHYKAINSNRRVYKCSVENCPHVINASIMLGRKAECPNCGELITITSEHLRRRIIACIGCGRAVKGGPVAKPSAPLDISDLLNRAKNGFSDTP